MICKTIYLRRFALYLIQLSLLVSCKTEAPDPAALEIDKAIELIHANKPINDTLQRYRQQYGVDFIFCYVITDDNYRRLGLQVMQSKGLKGPAILIDRTHKIETVQGIDVLFVSSDWDRTKKYGFAIDAKTKELIDNGYVTMDGPAWLFCTPSIDLVLCKDDEKVFTILSPDFKWKESEKLLKAGKPYDERKYYPKCN